MKGSDLKSQIKELEDRVDLLEKKIRSKLDYLLSEIQKLRGSTDQ
jgi:Tfp pilus assembly protein PilN